MDRVFFPEAAIIVIGIGDDVLGKHIVVNCRHHSFSSLLRPSLWEFTDHWVVIS
jgi:hypothetical protein